MSFRSGHYSIEELIALRESPLVTKPDLPPQMEQWINQPAIERRNLQNSQSHNNTENESKYRTADSRRSRGDSIILGPPQMSFASSLHSPPSRKSGNKDSVVAATRTRSSPPDDDISIPTSPQDEEEEGWSKVRSATRGRGFERRGMRGERRGGRETLDGQPPKATSFRNHREGESQNWRNERSEPPSLEYTRNGRNEERAEFLDEETFGGGGGKEHSAEEFQEWITKMRGGNPKAEEANETQNDDALANEASTEQPKIDKSKIVDVDSLFALDAPSLDETVTKAPASSVFFDSAPTVGRASRFRQLFAQDPPPQQQQAPLESENRPNVDRRQSLPMFNAAPKPGASAEDREGFQRIMAMLGGGGGNGGKSNMSGFFDKSPQPQLPLQPMQEGQNQGESKNEFFQRLLRQGQPMGGNPPPFTNPAMQMVRNNGPIDQQHQPRPSPQELDANMQNMHQRMNRPQPQQHPRSDPRFLPYDLHSPPPPPPPPPQGAPWMHPPPGFSPPNNRFPFPGPPLSPGGLPPPPPPPPPGGYGPPPPGMIPYGGPPPPGFGRGVFSPPLPPPGQDGWHPPPGFGGGFYQDGDGRER